MPCHPSNRFRDKLSFFSLGIEAKALNIVFGVTSVLFEVKPLLAKFSSSSTVKKERSEGNVHKSFEAKFNIWS